ncbi:hypothetical protein LMG23994_07192 [Cupriavidus pinatubonensis]|uniref:Uncharacterized protein n=1 Tax=Cupriavidus pinatubonensis TaxID=248026 RepID=A0ABM8Y4N6_9BURK|nr:hypothetical protein LMG23994_07192 [Cupriavidus pinatubonensis]
MTCGETGWLDSRGHCLVAVCTASFSRAVTLERVIGFPVRLGNSIWSSGAPFRCSQLLIWLAVERHKGTVRCFRPLPWICAQGALPKTTSPTRKLISSETRAPVLYRVANSTRSRWPHQVFGSGAASSASISSRERWPMSRRSKRFIGIANVLWITASAEISLSAAYFRNERMATSRAFRVRAQLCRSSCR